MLGYLSETLDEVSKAHSYRWPVELIHTKRRSLGELCSLFTPLKTRWRQRERLQSLTEETLQFLYGSTCPVATWNTMVVDVRKKSCHAVRFSLGTQALDKVSLQVTKRQTRTAGRNRNTWWNRTHPDRLGFIHGQEAQTTNHTTWALSVKLT